MQRTSCGEFSSSAMEELPFDILQGPGQPRDLAERLELSRNSDYDFRCNPEGLQIWT